MAPKDTINTGKEIEKLNQIKSKNKYKKKGKEKNILY